MNIRISTSEGDMILTPWVAAWLFEYWRSMGLRLVSASLIYPPCSSRPSPTADY